MAIQWVGKMLKFWTLNLNRLISEMIHIKEQKNGLKLNKDTELLDCLSYVNILYKLAKST